MEEKLALFKNRKRFGIEKNIDIIFKNTALVLSSFVAITLLGIILVIFFQAEDGIRDSVASRGLGDVYKRQQDKAPALGFVPLKGEILKKSIEAVGKIAR